MGKKPDLSGQITTYENLKIGNIALWDNETDEEKYPEYTGVISFYDGEKRFKIALWRREDKEDEKKDTIPSFVNE
ncbi:MAG: hypothetical protein ACLFUR_04240 [Candidatus Hadarchaeia archaeon]